MTRSKNTNKAVDNPEFLREIIQNQLQEYLEQEIAQHILRRIFWIKSDPKIKLWLNSVWMMFFRHLINGGAFSV